MFPIKQRPPYFIEHWIVWSISNDMKIIEISGHVISHSVIRGLAEIANSVYRGN